MGYLTQAISINFAPLLFVTFQNTYGISIGRISLLIGISFFTQLMSDIFVAKFNRCLNTRLSVIIAHLAVVFGMTGFAYLPEIMPDPYLGLVIATVAAAVGGGMIEVFISPIVQACPTKEKSSTMSFLHSFYCWGFAGTVLLSTLFFSIAGVEHWQMLSCLWALIPAIGALSFIFVPIYTLEGDGGESADNTPSPFFRRGLFWLFFILMFCAGAAEQAMSQWASSFAESGLGVSKAVGDILGPCAFALFMGASRLFYSKMGERIKLAYFIMLSALISVAAYMITALSPIAALSLAGCALCGLAVGIMWPGTYSLASQNIPGGTGMFAMLAVAGDIGCLTGPTAVGWIADAAGGDLKLPFLLASIFPLAIIFITRYILRHGGASK